MKCISTSAFVVWATDQSFWLNDRVARRLSVKAWHADELQVDVDSGQATTFAVAMLHQSQQVDLSSATACNIM